MSILGLIAHYTRDLFQRCDPTAWRNKQRWSDWYGGLGRLCKGLCVVTRHPKKRPPISLRLQNITTCFTVSCTFGGSELHGITGHREKIQEKRGEITGFLTLAVDMYTASLICRLFGEELESWREDSPGIVELSQRVLQAVCNFHGKLNLLDQYSNNTPSSQSKPFGNFCNGYQLLVWVKVYQKASIVIGPCLTPAITRSEGVW